MASRYVPPHVRNKGSSSSGQENSAPISKSSKHDEELFTPDDIEAHFWPKKFAADDLDQEGEASLRSTLHASEAHPEKLSYVILFKGANPRWFADKIIYAKSNLDLLPVSPDTKENIQSTDTPHNDEITEQLSSKVDPPKSANESKKSDASVLQHSTPISTPIAVFQEIAAPRPRSIRFAGYHTISHLDILQPHSPELIRMLEQKWSITDRHGRVKYKERDAESWNRSLRFKWAVIKFKSDPAADEERGTPKIERNGPNGDFQCDGANKSVNQMLRELRMSDESKEEEKIAVSEGIVSEMSSEVKDDRQNDE